MKLIKKITAFFAVVAANLLVVMPALAEEAAATASGKGASWTVPLCMGMAVAFGTYSQSRAASVGLEGMARNPAAAKFVNGPMIVSLAMMESLVLFAFIFSLIYKG